MTAVAAEAPAPRHGASWGGSVLAAVLATLEQPSSWAIGLLGFLARGGLLLFLAPILVLPTPAGIQAQLAPLVQSSYLEGSIDPAILPLIVSAVAIFAAILVAAGLIGGWADAMLIRRVADSLDRPAPAAGGRVVVAVLAVRAIAHLPFVIALGWGGGQIYAAVYAELVTPFEVVTPLVYRILGDVPAVLAVVGVAWWLGEAAGGIGARQVVLARRGVIRSAVGGWAWLVRHPASSIVTLVLGTLLVALAVVPALVASDSAWSRLRFLLLDGTSPAEITLALVLFVALWLGGLVLAGVATAARSALWTAEWLRHELVDDAERGTIGD